MLAPRVNLGHREILEVLDLLDHQGTMDFLEIPEQMELQDLQVCKVQMDNRVPREIVVIQVLQGIQEVLVKMELLDSRVFQETMVNKGRRVNLDPGEI